MSPVAPRNEGDHNVLMANHLDAIKIEIFTAGVTDPLVAVEWNAKQRMPNILFNVAENEVASVLAAALLALADQQEKAYLPITIGGAAS